MYKKRDKVNKRRGKVDKKREKVNKQRDKVVLFDNKKIIGTCGSAVRLGAVPRTCLRGK